MLKEYKRQWVKVESTMDRFNLVVHTKRLNGKLFKEGAKGFLILMYRSGHTGAHAHNVPLLVAPVHYTNFNNFHFRKWCGKKDDTACSSYDVVKESDSRKYLKLKLIASEPATDINWHTLDHWRNHATLILSDGSRPKDTMVSTDILNVTGLAVDEWKANGQKAQFLLEREGDR